VNQAAPEARDDHLDSAERVDSMWAGLDRDCSSDEISNPSHTPNYGPDRASQPQASNAGKTSVDIRQGEEAYCEGSRLHFQDSWEEVRYSSYRTL
jgi:hypothetical protein